MFFNSGNTNYQSFHTATGNNKIRRGYIGIIVYFLILEMKISSQRSLEVFNDLLCRPMYTSMSRALIVRLLTMYPFLTPDSLYSDINISIINYYIFN